MSSEFADPVARTRWSAPSNDALIYDEADFRVGGKDVIRCGPKGNPEFRGETRYLHVVPNARVVSSETVDMDGQRLAVALITLDFEPTDDGTNLTATLQIVSFAEPDMIHGYESGNKSALTERRSEAAQEKISWLVTRSPGPRVQGQETGASFGSG